MTSKSSGSLPVVLVDTCVISGLVRNDMKPADAIAFCEMADLVRKSELTIWTSSVAREEIDRIPAQYRQAHVDVYDALKTVRASRATWVETDPDSRAFGVIVEDPDYQALVAILKHENDARLVFHAKKGGVTDVVTVDYSSVLNKAPELAQLGIRVLSPAQYISSTSV